MTTLDYIAQKYSLDLGVPQMPIEIPNAGRGDLAILFKELGFVTGAEIGTERGAYAKLLCKANPSLRLYCIDSWMTYDGYNEHIGQEIWDGFYDTARQRLAPYNCELVRKFSMDAVKDFAPNSLDFVYIDANHEFRYMVDDLHEWSKRVRKGGVVAGHDFCRPRGRRDHTNVIEAVTGFTSSYRVWPWFVLGTKAVVAGQKRDSSRSYFWVKD